jgi:hypothetical protein
MRRKVETIVQGRFRFLTIRSRDADELLSSLERHVPKNGRIVHVHRLISFDDVSVWEVIVQTENS